MVRFSAALLTILTLFTTTVLAQDTDEKVKQPSGRKHQAGIRLGTWINTGEDPPEFAQSPDGTAMLETNFKDVNAYFEGRFAYNLFPQAFLEFSIGIVSRGSVTVQEQGFTDVGSLLLYPFLLQFKLYPLSPAGSRVQPYLAAGGGLYYGRQDVQFTTDYYYFATLNADSETDFNYVLSGGVDWYLNDYLALDFNLKYMPVNFSEELITIRDYSAFSVTVGITYVHGIKK